MQHLEIIAVMALVPLGAFVAMGEGRVLEWWAKFWARTGKAMVTRTGEDEQGAWMEHEYVQVHVFPSWLRKPLAACPRCMVSAWGIPAALLAFPDLNLWLLPVYILAACGLQEAIHQ